MTDNVNHYIYENQRWNPISGFTTASLPTDRHNWSDVTGRHKRSKEYGKMLSMHWQFVSDWIVDFHIPFGCDRDGWQYAIDFPFEYHPKKQFADTARRRRWYRKCRLTTRGPWKEVGQTRIVDVSLQSFSDSEEIVVWAISAAGDVLMRKNVTISTPAGNSWEHIPCDSSIASISCKKTGEVWTVSKSGAVFYRLGITSENRAGESWQRIEIPSNVQFKQISAGSLGVWAIERSGKLAVRCGINSTHPEGTHWQLLPNVINDGPNFEGDENIGFKCVSVDEVVMTISNSGYICKRNGITFDNPAGTGWTLGILGNWNHVCATTYK